MLPLPCATLRYESDLRALLNHAIVSIDEEQKADIVDDWLVVHMEERVDRRLLWQVLREIAAIFRADIAAFDFSIGQSITISAGEKYITQYSTRPVSSPFFTRTSRGCPSIFSPPTLKLRSAGSPRFRTASSPSWNTSRTKLSCR